MRHNEGVDVRALLRAAAQLAIAGWVAISLLAFVPVFPCSLLEHFRVQLVIVSGLPVALGLALRDGWLDAAIVALVVDLLPIAPDCTGSRRPVPDGEPLRVLVLNVHTESSSFEQVRQLIADERPDVIGLLEVNRQWLAELSSALA